MKLSLAWLRTHLDLSATDTARFPELLVAAGIEIEGRQDIGLIPDKVVVCQLTSLARHPNADRLSVCQVNDGTPHPRQIVTGATNMKAGDKIPLALPGSVLPGDFKIKSGKLRGEASDGMLCSARELNLGSDSAGLMILDPAAPVGALMRDLVPPDTVLDLEITPNRPDLLSHFGLAREIAALLAQSLPAAPAATLPAAVSGETSLRSVAVADPALCPLYLAREIHGVTVAPSPKWLRERLEAIGLRPISNLVDITNFVLHDLGHPLHAFDAALVGPEIHVLPAPAALSFPALDGKTYALQPGDLLIADAHGQPLALAGIIGGASSAVTTATTSIILEAATFAPAAIRRTAARLELSTDASYHFERGVPAATVQHALDRATQLILEIAGGSLVVPEPLRTGSDASPDTLIPLRHRRARQLLGANLTDKHLSAPLLHLGLRTEGLAPDFSSWRVPAWRLDLHREADLIEEICRLHGIANLPALLRARPAPASAVDAAHDLHDLLLRALASAGLSEARTFALISAKMCGDHLFSGEAGRLKNPLSEDQTHLRPSLVPGLLAVAERNFHLGAPRVHLFELGRTYDASANFAETDKLAILLSGPLQPPDWRAKNPPAAEIADLRGLIERLARGPVTLEPLPAEPGVPAALATPLRITADGIVLGHAGQLWPARLRDLRAPAPVLVAELHLPALAAHLAKNAAAPFREPPRHPAVTRDVALLAPAALRQQEIPDLLLAQNQPLLRSVQLFDIFTDPSGQKIPADQKSLAYTLTYRADDKTLESDKVDAIHARLLAALAAALPVQPR